MWLLELLSGKRKEASAPEMGDLDPHGDFPDIDEELEFDRFEGHNTLVYKEDGTAWLSNHSIVDAHVAARLLDVDVDRFFPHSPVEMKYYGNAAPDVKIYLLRNRVMRKENPPLWNHLKIREKGPVVLHYKKNKPRPILSSPDLYGSINVIKPRAVKIPTRQPCSSSPPIPGTFVAPVF